MHIRRSEDILDVLKASWTSYICLICVLCLWGSELARMFERTNNIKIKVTCHRVIGDGYHS